MSESIELIDCARRKLRLTAPACARFWSASNPVSPPVWEGRIACHQCPAGAARAGATLDTSQIARDRLARVCARCLKTSDRIINGRLCVSCYNRDREVKIGRNRKGGVPVRTLRKLFACRVVVVESGRIEVIERDKVSGPVELAICRLRRAKTSIVFGWAPPMSEAEAA